MGRPYGPGSKSQGQAKIKPFLSVLPVLLLQARQLVMLPAVERARRLVLLQLAQPARVAAAPAGRQLGRGRARRGHGGVHLSLEIRVRPPPQPALEIAFDLFARGLHLRLRGRGVGRVDAKLFGQAGVFRRAFEAVQLGQLRAESRLDFQRMLGPRLGHLDRGVIAPEHIERALLRAVRLLRIGHHLAGKRRAASFHRGFHPDRLQGVLAGRFLRDRLRLFGIDRAIIEGVERGRRRVFGDRPALLALLPVKQSLPAHRRLRLVGVREKLHVILHRPLFVLDVQLRIERAHLLLRPAVALAHDLRGDGRLAGPPRQIQPVAARDHRALEHARHEVFPHLDRPEAEPVVNGFAALALRGALELLPGDDARPAVRVAFEIFEDVQLRDRLLDRRILRDLGREAAEFRAG
jgi:hypothetical protein